MYTLVPPSYRCFTSNLALIGHAVSKKKIFEYYGDINVYCPGMGADEPLGSNFSEFFFPGRDQYYSRLFLWVCCFGSTRRLNREVDFCCCFWRSPGSNLRPLIYKASDLTTAPWRLLNLQYIFPFPLSFSLQMTF